ncbi:glycosyltransferase family 2 protein [Herbiconiux moechotypicola]|uniref:Glycosyltransferase 2-like domain-containing protein n=1 Tax=Herbiconiux moechotypicola TaxID=637393 RepID=A0ABN3DRP5_9MICO|nr:glycosyltransferase family A protein [Herbiconiux moechotypicola]MCS5731504.1 glycosyltransferase family 2 protein [Herbiconiux moechotypicola]
MPSITVIAPLHNAAEYVADFLIRIENTVRPGDQLILIDDGSSDETGALITEWAAGRADVLALVNSENIGVAATRNRAIASADREFIWFVDHDDVWERSILDVLGAAAQGADAVICRAEYRVADGVPGRIVDGIDEHRRVSGDQAVELMLLGKVHGYLWTKLLRRTTLGDDPFPHQSSQSDFVGVTRTLARASTVVTIPEVLYFYMHRDGSITRKRAPNLDNYAASRAAMADVVSSSEYLQSRPELFGFFNAWFYCHAVVFVPVRSHADPALVRRGLALARSNLRGTSIRMVGRFSKRSAIEMAAIRYGGPAYPPALRVALALHDRLRAIRSHRREGAAS